MIEGGIGGANTKTGLVFEKKADLKTLIKKIPDYSVKLASVYKNQIIKTNALFEILYKDKLVAYSFQKYAFYNFLELNNIDYKKLISCKILPDDALLVIVRDTLFIIEIKFQRVGGSVDEKLQTCDFKRKQYQKLVKPLNLKVEYVFVLNDWFKHPRYKDVLDYVSSMNCHYHFNEIPLSWLGLPPYNI